MKLEFMTMRLTDDSGSEYRISRYDEDGDELGAGLFAVTSEDDDQTVVVTEPVLRALVRAAEAFATGALLD